MSRETELLLKDFHRAKTGASPESIGQISESLGATFPPDYVAFLQESNGGCGDVGSEGFLKLWPIETLVERNRGYKTSEFFPGFVFIGSNGGGEAIAVREAEYFLVPFIGDVREAISGGRTLVEFLSAFGSGKIWDR